MVKVFKISDEFLCLSAAGYQPGVTGGDKLLKHEGVYLNAVEIGRLTSRGKSKARRSPSSLQRLRK